MSPSLPPEWRDRYARHLSMPEIGATGQQRIADGRILVVGVGGLGSPAALYLAAAGVGTLALMDGDRVEPSNLQRQILYASDHVGHAKVDRAAERIRSLNPLVRVLPIEERLEPGTAADRVAEYDIILDATDNFDSKFLIASACARAGRPYVHAGIRNLLGQAMTVLPGQTACYACAFEAPPPAVPGPPIGPLGAIPGILGSIQALEAIKLLLQISSLLTNRLWVLDGLTMNTRVIPVRRRQDCPVCG